MKNYGSQFQLDELIKSGKIFKIIGEEYDENKMYPCINDMHEKSLENFLRIFMNKNNIVLRKKLDTFDSWWIKYGGKKPTWDLLAFSKDEKKIALLEAKAHEGECAKSMHKANEKNEKSIQNNEQIKQNIDVELKNISSNAKYEGYYQIANRLAYANYVRDHFNLDVELIFLGFLNESHFSDCFNKKNSFIEKLENIIYNGENKGLNINKNQKKIIIKIIEYQQINKN